MNVFLFPVFAIGYLILAWMNMFFISSFCYCFFDICLDERVFLFPLFAVGYLLFAWMNV